ncbi:hypothetical protein K504DRAFT_445433 [Pleomassaria siparia CBS 279.74]|uniref:Uncharacterized protein n=1 Tax=Pleomassaria siparia CBS 279.74 TaxID=1314801 RepID=A0A6G1KNL4_9PLEO|nr:hypothetical protein K504DRAFT_445433 [Pleomassaria siparia CBS 279.74]
MPSSDYRKLAQFNEIEGNSDKKDPRPTKYYNLPVEHCDLPASRSRDPTINNKSKLAVVRSFCPHTEPQWERFYEVTLSEAKAMCKQHPQTSWGSTPGGKRSSMRARVNAQLAKLDKSSPVVGKALFSWRMRNVYNSLLRKTLHCTWPEYVNEEDARAYAGHTVPEWYLFHKLTHEEGMRLRALQPKWKFKQITSAERARMHTRINEQLKEHGAPEANKFTFTRRMNQVHTYQSRSTYTGEMKPLSFYLRNSTEELLREMPDDGTEEEILRDAIQKSRVSKKTKKAKKKKKTTTTPVKDEKNKSHLP